MSSARVAAAAAALLVALPAAARAQSFEAKDAKEKRERRSRLFEQVRIGLSGVLGSGTSLVGVGSRGHYRRGGVAIELEVHRLVTDWFGFGLVFQGFPPTAPSDAGRELVFGRGEGFLEAGAAAWRGALPGSLVFGAGFGGDGPRYWFAEHGRFYAIAFGRVRLFLSRDTRLQITYAPVPVALAAQHVRLHEHRFEVAASWKLLQVGTRLAYTFSRGGDPVRDYFQQELGAFVGLSVY
jgi:hypothetical protein